MTDYAIDYIPHLHQKEFHDSDAKLRTIIAGIRSGKSLMSVNELIKLAAEGCKYFKTPNRGAVVLASYPMLKDVIVPLFQEYCPEEALSYWSSFHMKARFKNNSEILFRSADEPKKLKGLDLNWFWIDEAALVKEEVYLILKARVSQKGGIGWITTTPDWGGLGQRWVQKLAMKARKGKDSNLFFKTWSSYDNPFYSKEDVDALKDDYTSEYFNQEVMAEFVTFSGLVYPEFDHQRIWKFRRLPNFEYFIVGVDFGYTHPACMLLIGVGGENFYVIKEFYEKHKLTKDLIEQLQIWHADTPIKFVYCDPSRPDYIEEFQGAGFNAFAGNNKVLEGISRVKQLLKSKRLFVASECKNLLREFATYSFRRNSELPLKEDDNASDACRYGLATEVEEQKQSSDLFIAR